jgi:hypothetical protein
MQTDMGRHPIRTQLVSKMLPVTTRWRARMAFTASLRLILLSPLPEIYESQGSDNRKRKELVYA